MSRRDIIIVTILINTGLLAVLFMMAMNLEEQVQDEEHMVEELVVEKIEEKPELKPEPVAFVQANTADELDNILKEFSLTLPKKEEKKIEAEPEKQNFVEVTVKRGDCLGKIALANQTTVREIVKANQLKNEKVRVGQVLQVPIGTKKIVKIQKIIESPKLINEDPEYYTMKSGDNPWNIAKKYRVGFDELLRLNELDEEKARNLKVGDKIRVK